MRNAKSGRSRTIALMRGLTSWMRSRCASTTSRTVTEPSRINPARSPAPRAHKSTDTASNASTWSGADDNVRGALATAADLVNHGGRRGRDAGRTRVRTGEFLSGRAH